ncbi:MAG: hypothetical protein ACFFAJ_06605 [Candidatus Hodarchaeota archaeon]
MTSKSKISSIDLPFLDEVFLNSPLCQICEFANYGIGGVCSLLLNRRIPVNLVIQESKIISCSMHRNWISGLGISTSPDDLLEDNRF